MVDCRICAQDCSIHEDVRDALKENCRNYKPKPMTRADRIRAMTDEELAEKIGESMDCEFCKTMHHDDCPTRPTQSCVDFWLEWLKLGATDD